MTKAEIIAQVEKAANINKAAAAKAVEAVIGGIRTALKKGQKVTFVGFGTFSVGTRRARKGRNPKTGDIITIKASKVVKFKAGRKLKDAVK